MREFQEKASVTISEAGECALDVYLEIRQGMGKDGFEIRDASGGGIRITGNDERGLLYGVGRLLHTSNYNRNSFIPGDWRGVSVPNCPVRGIYFASHLHNFYHDAPIGEVQRYLEDLALWGFNALNVFFDMMHYTGMNDPKAQTDIARFRTLLEMAKDLGFDTSLACIANEAYDKSPPELRADWSAGHDGYFAEPDGHYHLELCPNKPGALEMEMRWFEEKMAAFKDVGLDYLWIWPYDTGGCTCAQCKPWGANGFLKAAEPLARAYRRHFPKGKVVLSTWNFDRFTTGEWAGLAENFNQNHPDWLDYIMADNVGMQFPLYPIQHEIPGGFPLLNFPEISMFANWPWGGYGINPYPRRLQSMWNLARDKLSGGFPYSEGIYEDLNKVICSQFYWDPEKSAGETMREYIAYYFSSKVTDQVIRALEIFERNMERKRVDQNGVTRLVMTNTDGANEAYRLIMDADMELPTRVRISWRWRIICLRALIDFELANHDFRVCYRLPAAFAELVDISHAEQANDLVSPPRQILGILHPMECRH